MKLLIISPTFFPDVGGVETMLYNFCDNLAVRKFQTDIITYNPLIAKVKAPIKEKINEFVTVWRIPWIGRGLFNIFEHYPLIQFLYLVPMLTFVTIIFLIISKHKIDTIHVFGLSGAFAGGIASKIFNIPCVADMCTVYRLPKRPMLAWFVRKILNLCSYIRGNNTIGKEELIKIGISSNKLGIISPAVDENIFKPISQTEARKKLGLSLNKFIILFIGRMVESKNVDIAVKVTSLVKNTDVIFMFVGEGPLKKLVDDAAKTDKRILATNNVKHHDLVYYYNSGDILICAPVDKNLIAFVGRESLMCGLPILALNIATYAGIPYKVNKDLIPNEIGYLLDLSPQVIANYLNKLIDFKKVKGKLPFNKKDCRNYALQNFSSKAMDWIGDSYEKAKNAY